MSVYVCVCVYVCVVALWLHRVCMLYQGCVVCVCGCTVVASCVHVVVAGSLLFTLSCELLFSESHLLIALVSGQAGQKEVWGRLTK